MVKDWLISCFFLGASQRPRTAKSQPRGLSPLVSCVRVSSTCGWVYELIYVCVCVRDEVIWCFFCAIACFSVDHSSQIVFDVDEIFWLGLVAKFGKWHVMCWFGCCVRILMVHDLRTDCSSFRGVPGWINVGCLKDGACFFCVLVILVITHAICRVQLLLSDRLLTP